MSNRCIGLIKTPGKQKFFAGDGTKSVISAIDFNIYRYASGYLDRRVCGTDQRRHIRQRHAGGHVKLVFLGHLQHRKRWRATSPSASMPVNLGNMLFRATPLILTGLSVAVAFKTGLFNIGAPGQYLSWVRRLLNLHSAYRYRQMLGAGRVSCGCSRFAVRHSGGRAVGSPFRGRLESII